MDLVEIKGSNVNRHPWELSRAESIIHLLNKMPADSQFADVGSGDLYFAKLFEPHLKKNMYVVDIGYTETGQDGKLIKMKNIADLPDDTIDVIILLDVIEHIEDVDPFLKEVTAKLKDDGKVFITVPAWQFLFSDHDRYLLHFRRYNKKLLKEQLERNGLEIENSFYFYTSLFFARCLTALLQKGSKPGSTDQKGIGAWGFPKDHFATSVIRKILNTDFKINLFLNKLGINFPGLSLYALCRKKSS